MNRLGLFLCFDSEGTIDEYVKVLLEDMKKNLSDLCIIVNGDLSDESRMILMQYSTDIISRPNIGFDSGGWRDAMIDHIGFEKLQEYDEIILFNDSFFGPIYPFKEMFDTMDSKDIDFWGITVHSDTHNARNLCPYGYRPRYLQTYFLAFRQNLVKSKEFQEYWSNLPNFTDFNHIAFKHQAVFTRYFSDLGFKCAAYVDTIDLEETIDNPVSFHTFNMFDMVVNRRLPVIKRKAFKLPRQRHLRYNVGREISSTMEYIDKHTDYDVSLIYEYFLRIQEPDALMNTLNSVRIFSKNDTIQDSDALVNTLNPAHLFSKKDKNVKFSNKKIAVIAHLYYSDLWEYAYNFMKNIPECIDIFITTDTNEKKEIFEENILNKLKNKSQVLLVNNRGRELAGLFVGCKDIIKNYDYFCFIHDKKPEGEDYITVYNSFRDILWENMLASTDYIKSIVKEFDKNPNLGLIVPPKISHGTYFASFADKYWTESFEETQNLLEQMDIDKKISRDYPPISMGNCFWAKYDALKPLFDLGLDYDDFPEESTPQETTIIDAIERSYGYVAASQSYYPEIVMTEEFGRIEFSNYEHMFSNLLSACKKSRNKKLVFDKTYEHFIQSLQNVLGNPNPKEIKKLKNKNKQLEKQLKNIKNKMKSEENLRKKLQKHNIARIDIKNIGIEENNVNILNISDSSAHSWKPSWFKNSNGAGLIIESQINSLELEIQCVLDGKLNIQLRGIDYRLEDDSRFMININYTKFMINDEIVFNGSKILNHDSPFIFEKDVSNNETIKLYLEWMPV